MKYTGKKLYGERTRAKGGKKKSEKMFAKGPELLDLPNTSDMVFDSIENKTKL
jgi:hypothetical protein